MKELLEKVYRKLCKAIKKQANIKAEEGALIREEIRRNFAAAGKQA
jgi:hypothetical protein